MALWRTTLLALSSFLSSASLLWSVVASWNEQQGRALVLRATSALALVWGLVLWLSGTGLTAPDAVADALLVAQDAALDGAAGGGQLLPGPGAAVGAGAAFQPAALAGMPPDPTPFGAFAQ